MNTMTVATQTTENVENNGSKYPTIPEVLGVITRKEFCIIWKKISNDKRTKPQLVEHKSYDGGTYTVKEKGWIYPQHHIIYNLVRGLPVTRGFKEGTEGYENALKFLQNSSNFNYVSYLHKAFAEFMTAEQFKSLLLEVQPLVK